MTKVISLENLQEFKTKCDEIYGDNVVDLGTLGYFPDKERYKGKVTAEQYAQLANPNTVVKFTLSGNEYACSGVVNCYNPMTQSYILSPIEVDTAGIFVMSYFPTITSTEIIVQTYDNSKMPSPTYDQEGKILGVRAAQYALIDPSGGTTVVANPTLSGSEAELTGLEVAGTKYKVPSGGGIVAVDSLPTPSQTEYEKHLLYLQGGELNFIAEKVAEEPTATEMAAGLQRDSTNTCAVAIGTDAYIFGGENREYITKFDSVSQTATTLRLLLPSEIDSASAVAIGTNAYIFGGSDNGDTLSSIVKFDSISQTVTTLTATLPSARYNASAVAIGTDAYVFGGYKYKVYYSDIVKFDSVSQTVTTLGAVLPVGKSNASAVAIGTDAYIFGGSDGGNLVSDIVKFDSISQTVTKLTATLPSARRDTSAVVIGTNAYIFGGYDGARLSDIVKFDSVSQTVTKLTTKLPYEIYDTSAVAIGTDAYTFGGYTSFGMTRVIFQVSFGKEYVYKQITSTEV